MKTDRAGRRILDVLELSPELKHIFLSTDSLDSKRIQIMHLLDRISLKTYDREMDTPRLEWILARDAINVLKNILTVRNEEAAGYSFLQYIDDLLNRPDSKDLPEPSPGFLAEVYHLIKGIFLKSGIYSGKTLTFQKHSGRKAAKLRSEDLSRMMRAADKRMGTYSNGLEKHVIARRRRNKRRILSYFNADAAQWESWNWQMGHAVRNAEALADLIDLTEDEYRAVKSASEFKIPFGITPYYLSLMDRDSKRVNDYAVRAQVIPTMHYVRKMKALRENRHLMDFMQEHDTSPIDGITRRYPGIVILKPVISCPQICVYCQRNWEIKDVTAPDVAISKDKLQKAIAWISETPEIHEVLITGGDPFILSDNRLRDMMKHISEIDHVQRVRIGTRTPVTLPMRITDKLAGDIARYHVPGKREVVIVTHFEHPYEITPEAMQAVQKFRLCGIDVYNQLVYTFFNSRKFEACLLRQTLRLIGVTPYYTFSTKGKEETDDFRVPIARLLQEQKEEARLFPGTVRTDEIVFNLPRLGKNYLRAGQHHDIISILPNGRRVYEFHPWEKKLELAQTYLHEDVPIYNYLQRLREIGENPDDYKSIWYYY
ncbi:MAG: KamA family radical SAM protein [Desulfobacterales bacterium]